MIVLFPSAAESSPSLIFPDPSAASCIPSPASGNRIKNGFSIGFSNLSCDTIAEVSGLLFHLAETI